LSVDPCKPAPYYGERDGEERASDHDNRNQDTPGRGRLETGDGIHQAAAETEQLVEHNHDPEDRDR
jgi:hypothetical protein